MYRVVLSVLIVCLALTACGGETTPTPDAVATQAAAVKAATATLTAEAVHACQEFATQWLLAPATAQFPPLDTAEVKRAYDIQGNEMPQSYEVRSYVDAQNAFGALIRQRYQCIVTLDGRSETWTLEDVNFYEDEWELYRDRAAYACQGFIRERLPDAKFPSPIHPLVARLYDEHGHVGPRAYGVTLSFESAGTKTYTCKLQLLGYGDSRYSWSLLDLKPGY